MFNTDVATRVALHTGSNAMCGRITVFIRRVQGISVESEAEVVW